MYIIILILSIYTTSSINYDPIRAETIRFECVVVEIRACGAGREGGAGLRGAWGAGEVTGSTGDP